MTHYLLDSVFNFAFSLPSYSLAEDCTVFSCTVKPDHLFTKSSATIQAIIIVPGFFLKLCIIQCDTVEARKLGHSQTGAPPKPGQHFLI